MLRPSSFSANGNSFSVSVRKPSPLHGNLWNAFMMQGGVFSQRDDFKIFKSVVKFFSVFVVNYFVTAKLSAKMLFHKVTMLKNLLSVNVNGSVSTAMNTPFSLLNNWLIQIKSMLKSVMVSIAKSKSAMLLNTTINRAFSIRRLRASFSEFLVKAYTIPFSRIVKPAMSFCVEFIQTASNFTTEVFSFHRSNYNANRCLLQGDL